MLNEINTINAITLPSFLRRTIKAYALKAQIRLVGCELHRIGRSRNWQIKANFEQVQAIINFIEQAEETSWLWLAKLLKQQCQNLNHASLITIAKQMPTLTISALTARTDCTIVQARKVIDALEGLD